ncbi:MAG TPA: class I SAM-dependent methyltransferase [Pyrinomonadaceae bacterium]|nr:class I SAM-dependent methyltransferase [Pyrinomonadaceae bacterium]
MNINLILHKLLRVPTAYDYIKGTLAKSDCSLTLDVGCGGFSHLTHFRPAITSVGLDVFPQAIEKSKANRVHDQYIVGDILRESADDLLARAGGRKFDLVMLYDVIEHLPKRRGYELLEKCEELSSKYVLLQTPNGFLPQGPEFGNEHQRHLSGWFPHDFEGLGYKVLGARGTKYLRGYAGGPKFNFPGWMTCDIALASLLRIRTHPRHAFNLVAIKDVRGVPARFVSAAASE